MSTSPMLNLCPRYYLPLPLSNLPTKVSLFAFKPFSLLSASPCSSSLQTLNYGPSLPKIPNPNPNSLPDPSHFTRSFDIAALRVPADDCSALEHRLRGHLLNWPRIRNVARVAGDDVDPDFEILLSNQPSVTEQRLDSLRKLEDVEGEEAAYSAVLHREKLVKDFNCKGYLNFRNLARVSRPKKEKKKTLEGKESKSNKERGQNEKHKVYSVQVVKNKDEEEDWSGLLGDGFKGGSKWIGPTRLLLLDERYAKKGVDELPQAVKAVLVGGANNSTQSVFELVQCCLTLHYNYWQMNEVLNSLLPDGIIVPTGFETVGHIAHLNLSSEHVPYKKLIAQVVLDKNKAKIKTVVNKVDAIQNDYRTMELEVLAGSHSLSTAVIENGTRFLVDLKAVYWNSKLAGERQRLVGRFCESDVVCDVFSGVGPIAILAAKKVKYVYANDLNPTAVEYLERNIVLNKLDKKIEVSNMDGRRFIQSIFAKSRTKSITQVVMNLPKDAAEFLDCFRGIFGKQVKDSCCILPRIHLYGFSKAENPEFDFHERINLALCETVEEVEMYRVRLVAPGKWMLCASFTLPKLVTFT